MAAEVTEVHATIAEVVQFNRVTKGPPVEETDESEADEPEADEPEAVEESGLDTLNDIFAEQDPTTDQESALVIETMYEETVLEVGVPNGSVGDTGPSDASAVPELSPVAAVGRLGTRHRRGLPGGAERGPLRR